MKLKRWYCGGPVGGSLDYHRKDGIMNRNFVLQQAIEDNPTKQQFCGVASMIVVGARSVEFLVHDTHFINYISLYLHVLLFV